MGSRAMHTATMRSTEAGHSSGTCSHGYHGLSKHIEVLGIPGHCPGLGSKEGDSTMQHWEPSRVAKHAETYLRHSR